MFNFFNIFHKTKHIIVITDNFIKNNKILTYTELYSKLKIFDYFNGPYNYMNVRCNKKTSTYINTNITNNLFNTKNKYKKKYNKKGLELFNSFDNLLNSPFIDESIKDMQIVVFTKGNKNYKPDLK